MFTVTSFQAMPTNSLALPSPSLGVYQCNKLDMRTFWEQTFYTNAFYFIWSNFLSVGIVDILLQSAGTGKYATSTRHLKLYFTPLAVSYQLFPCTVRSNTIGFLLNQTQQYRLWYMYCTGGTECSAIQYEPLELCWGLI